MKRRRVDLVGVDSVAGQTGGDGSLCSDWAREYGAACGYRPGWPSATVAASAIASGSVESLELEAGEQQLLLAFAQHLRLRWGSDGVVNDAETGLSSASLGGSVQCTGSGETVAPEELLGVVAEHVKRPVDEVQSVVVGEASRFSSATLEEKRPRRPPGVRCEADGEQCAGGSETAGAVEPPPAALELPPAAQSWSEDLLSERRARYGSGPQPVVCSCGMMQCPSCTTRVNVRSSPALANGAGSSVKFIGGILKHPQRSGASHRRRVAFGEKSPTAKGKRLMRPAGVGPLGALSALTALVASVSAAEPAAVSTVASDAALQFEAELWEDGGESDGDGGDLSFFDTSEPDAFGGDWLGEPDSEAYEEQLVPKRGQRPFLHGLSDLPTPDQWRELSEAPEPDEYVNPPGCTVSPPFVAGAIHGMDPSCGAETPAECADRWRELVPDMPEMVA